LALLLPDTDVKPRGPQQSSKAARNNSSDGQGHGGRGVRSVGRE
jgi:hypothetical protein